MQTTVEDLAKWDQNFYTPKVGGHCPFGAENLTWDPAVVDEKTGMMKDTIQLLDVVALTVDLPEVNLRRGQVGTVVDVLSGGRAFEVEFCDREGRTYASLGLRPDQVMLLRYVPEAATSESRE